MTPTYDLARDHLEEAVLILRGSDAQTQQLRLILERTLELMSEVEDRARRERGNVFFFERYRKDRPGT